MTMRRAALALTALVITMGIGVGAFLMGAESATPAPTQVMGTYDVPGGQLTVYGDYSARYESLLPEGDVMGGCWVDTLNNTTGEQHRPYYACAPLHAPDGAPLGGYGVEEDGSASYLDSPYSYDPEEAGFVQRPSQVVRGIAPGAPTLTVPSR